MSRNLFYAMMGGHQGVMMFARMRLFQKTATAVLVVFMGLMVLVTVVAYSRQSGATRQDMSKAQMLRSQVAEKKSALDRSERK